LPSKKRFFVAVVELESHLGWLEAALGTASGLVASDEPSVDRVLQLVDTASASAVFVRFGPLDHAQRSQLVLRMLDRKPNLAVIGVGESDDRELMLSVLRSGARDFIPIGASAIDVHAAVERVFSRHAALETTTAQGSAHAIVCARPDGASTSLAVHLALAIRRIVAPEEKVLLLDLGAPVGDSLLFLDLRPTYNFVDAVRSVRRFDQTLIHAAFASHKSGLSVLALPEDPSELESVQATDAIALTGVLKAYFDHVVVNLAGMFDLDQLFPMLEKATSVLVHTDQCVASCRANFRLLEAIRQAKVPLTNSRLVVDRFHPKIDPPADQIAELLGMERWSCIPPDGLRMVEALNTGQPIFDLAPSCGYSKAVAQLAHLLLDRDEPSAARGPLRALWARLRTRPGAK